MSNGKFTISFSICFFLLLVLFSSCRKEKLNYEKEVLVGRWSFYHSYSVGGGSNNYAPGDKNYHEIEFHRKGCIALYDYQNKLIEKYRFKSIELFNTYEYQPPLKAYSFKVEIKTSGLGKKDKGDFEKFTSLIYYEGDNTFYKHIEIENGVYHGFYK